MMDHIPLALGRRSVSDRGGHRGDGGAEVTRGAKEELGPSRGTRLSTVLHRSSEGGAGSTAGRTATMDDGGSTTTSTTTVSGGSCGEWLRKQKKRTTPDPLTDDERMSLLQHVRPSVFGEPAALDRRRGAVVCARPRSAAAAPGSRSVRHNRHEPPRANTARRRSREGQQPGWADAAGRKHHAASGCNSRVGASKHGGVLVHDGWVAGEGEPLPGSLLVSTAAGQASPRGSRLRPGGSGGTSGSGSARQVSLVNSISFGVNMGVLDALSDTTASATAATAFASAAAGEARTVSKSLFVSETSTTHPWLSSAAERTSGRRKSDMPRGQSAPLTGRRKRDSS